MSEHIQANYVLSKDMVSSMLGAHRKVVPYPLKGWVGKLLLIVLFLITPLLLAVLIFETQQVLKEPVLQGMFLVIGMFWFLLIFTKPDNFIIKKRLTRQIIKLPEEQRTHSFLFTEEEVKSSSLQTTMISRWNAFSRFAETPSGYLLYFNDINFLWLPPKSFRSDSEMRRFAELAKRRVANHVMIGSVPDYQKTEA